MHLLAFYAMCLGPGVQVCWATGQLYLVPQLTWKAREYNIQ